MSKANTDKDNDEEDKARLHKDRVYAPGWMHTIIEEIAGNARA